MEKRERIQFGKRMAAIMKRKGMNQTILSEKVGISKAAISCTLREKYEPKLNTLIRYAEALDVTMDDLCGVRTAATKNESEQLRTIAMMVLEDTRDIYSNLQNLNKHARMLERWARRYRVLEDEDNEVD